MTAVATRSRVTSLARRHGILVVFVFLVAVLFATKSTFGTYQNIINVLQQNSVIGIIAYISSKSSGEISEFGTHRSLWRI